METLEARQITDSLYGINVMRSKIDAIKMLRGVSGMGLKEAKDWVDDHERLGVVGFHRALIAEFCHQQPEELLKELKEQRRQLDIRIRDLEERLGFELREEMWKEYFNPEQSIPTPPSPPDGRPDTSEQM